MKITLIVPCYNEIVNIQKGVLDKIGDYTKSDSRFQEVLIVDDGSTDQSKQLIKKVYLPRFPQFRLIENKHLGKAFTIIRGIEEAKNEYIMFSDIDLATPLEEADKLIHAASKNYAVVIGSRSSQRQGAPLTRKIMAFGMIMLRSLFVGLPGIKDTQCGFKLFSTEAARNIVKRLIVFQKKQAIQGSSVSAGFDLEFLFLAKKLGYKIKEIPVLWRHVETKNVNFIRDSIETLKDMISIKYYDLKGRYSS